MVGHKLHFSLLFLYILVATGKKHKNSVINSHVAPQVRTMIQGQNSNGFGPFHSTQNIDDLVKNPTALNSDEASEINKLDNLNDVFMNPEVTSETQDLSSQGLDPYVAMQISKLDHNFKDIFGSRGGAPNSPPNAAATPPQSFAAAAANAKQKEEILPGYGEQFNMDGSVSLSKDQWPEYQIKDTLGPGMQGGAGMHKPAPMSLPGNGLNSQQPLLSPQAGLNPNLLPGQKMDLGFGMGVGAGADLTKGGPPMLSGFANDATRPTPPAFDKSLLNPAFKTKPEVKSAGFHIPGEYAFKGQRKSGGGQIEAEDKKFLKNFMSAKKSKTARRKSKKQGNIRL